MVTSQMEEFQMTMMPLSDANRPAMMTKEAHPKASGR